MSVVLRACYGVLRFIMESGAKGCEVVVSGKLRGQRAKSMKFVDGLMIHSGDPVNYYVDTAVRHVLLRQGEIKWTGSLIWVRSLANCHIHILLGGLWKCLEKKIYKNGLKWVLKCSTVSRESVITRTTYFLNMNNFRRNIHNLCQIFSRLLDFNGEMFREFFFF